MRAERGERHVLPSQVSARGSGGERDISAVVDEDGNGKGGNQRPRQLHDIRGVAIFPADLNHRCAAADGGATD